jgi:ABC-2 type transport system ATP-binding protein
MTEPLAPQADEVARSGPPDEAPLDLAFDSVSLPHPPPRVLHAAPAGHAANGAPAPQSAPQPGPVDERGTPAIELRNLHRYFGTLKAVHAVSFKAWPGQVMGYIGPNGSGKTTSMRILATLDVPTAGDAFVFGHSVVDYPDEVRKLLGFMPDTFGRYANTSVTEYLDFYARAYGLSGARRRDALERVLVFTELRKVAEKPIDSLSKGMAQRLGLGRTLIHDPQVLVMDEPAAGLDPRARVELRELIHLLARTLRKTILISSHILTELGEICDAAAIIEAGRIVAHGTVEDLLRQQRARQGKSQTTSVAVRVLDRSELLERWLVEQPHVSVATSTDRIVSFEFTGDEAQRHELLKRMLQADFPVVEFHAKSESLEDAFMALTRGLVQ